MTAQGLVVADAFRQVLNGTWPYAQRNPAPGSNGAILIASSYARAQGLRIGFARA